MSDSQGGQTGLVRGLGALDGALITIGSVLGTGIFLTGSDIAAYGLPPSPRTRCYVCGPTGFVEAAVELLLKAGFATDNIRTERFGP